MNKYILTILYFAFSIVASQAQTLKGTISDQTDKTPLVGATIKLANTGINPLSVVSDKKGGFIFQNIASGNYTLSIASIGYEPYQKTVTVSDNITNDLGAITLLKTAKVLNTVTINSIIPPVRQKADTLEYAANAYKVNPDANAEDLVKKMPGVTVDNGTVTAHGETVKKVTIDGGDFFGDDATAALRNMPAEVINKIQIFDRLSGQAAFTGFDDGSSVKECRYESKYA